MGFLSTSDAISLIQEEQTDADSDINELLISVLRKNEEQKLIKDYYTGVSGTLTSTPNGSGVCTDSAQSMTVDAHIGHTVVFTSGSAKGNMYTIDDNDATTFTLTGDDPAADGVLSGDAYKIFYDLLGYTDGHSHNGIDSAIVALADGQITESKYAAGSVNQTALKTSTGSASGNVTAGVYIAGNAYQFDANHYTADASLVSLTGYSSSISDQTARWGFYNSGSSVAYASRWRYITATDNPFIYAIRDKNTGKILSLWESEDPHLMSLWNLDQLPDVFERPVMHTNIDLKDPDAKYEEIILHKYPMEDFLIMRDRIAANSNDLPFKTIENTFDFDEDKRLFKPKNLIEI